MINLSLEDYCPLSLLILVVVLPFCYLFIEIEHPQQHMTFPVKAKCDFVKGQVSIDFFSNVFSDMSEFRHRGFCQCDLLLTGRTLSLSYKYSPIILTVTPSITSICAS